MCLHVFNVTLRAFREGPGCPSRNIQSCTISGPITRRPCAWRHRETTAVGCAPSRPHHWSTRREPRALPHVRVVGETQPAVLVMTGQHWEPPPRERGPGEVQRVAPWRCPEDALCLNRAPAAVPAATNSSRQVTSALSVCPPVYVCSHLRSLPPHLWLHRSPSACVLSMSPCLIRVPSRHRCPDPQVPTDAPEVTSPWSSRAAYPTLGWGVLFCLLFWFSVFLFGA